MNFLFVIVYGLRLFSVVLYTRATLFIDSEVLVQWWAIGGIVAIDDNRMLRILPRSLFFPPAFKFAYAHMCTCHVN